MSKKRTSLKGRGAEIFLSGGTKPKEEDYASIPLHPHTNIPAQQLTKATFYLNTTVVDDLENLWVKLRKASKDKKISKSQIVSQVLGKTILELSSQPEDEIIKFLR